MPDSTPPTYVIEDGIPVPPHGNAKTANFRMTLRAMMPGQSVFTSASRDSVARAANDAKLATGKEYTVRAVEGGLRVWCVESDA